MTLEERPVPPTLYKYLPPERADIFETGKVRFSQQSALNDPLEFHVELNLRHDLAEHIQAAMARITPEQVAEAALLARSDYKDLLAKLPETTRPDTHSRMVNEVAALAGPATDAARLRLEEGIDALLPSVGTAFATEVAPALERHVRVFSCTANPMCVPMWAHYAETHRGFQIAFDPRRIFAGNSDAGSPTPIEYSDEPAVLTGPEDNFIYLLRKAPDWAYEREWRYLMELDLDEDVTPALLHLVDFEIEAIEEVTFGLQASSETIARVRAALAARRHAPKLSHIVRGIAYRLEKQPLEADA